MDRPSRFELTEDAADRRLRTRPLNSSSNRVPPSKALCPSLAQGTPCDCFSPEPQPVRPSTASPHQLVDSELRASSLNIPALDNVVSSVPLSARLPGGPPSSITLPPVDTLPAGPPSPSSPTDILASNQSTVDPGTESPEAFFTNALGSPEEIKRVKLLASVVRGFPTAEEFSKGFSDGLQKRLSRWSCFFSSKLELRSEAQTDFEVEVAHRFTRLKHARYEIKRKNQGDTRLWLICLVHEMDYISQWKDIELYTSRGVGAMSVAIRMATKYMETATGDYKRGRNIVEAMEEGGPALMLEYGGVKQAQWERFIVKKNVTQIYAYVRNKLPDLDKVAKSHNSDVSNAILNIFKMYGWSTSKLLDSETRVVKMLKSHLQYKRSHASDESGLEPQYKRCRVDHDVPAKPLDLISSPRIIDVAIGGHSDYTSHGSNEFTDPSSASIFGYTVNSLDEFTDLSTANNASYVNSSSEITDFNTADLFQSAYNPSMDEISNHYEIDPSSFEFLQWTVSELDMLTEPSTDIFIQGATSPNQVYLTGNLIQPYDHHLPNASQTPGAGAIGNAGI